MRDSILELINLNHRLVAYIGRLRSIAGRTVGPVPSDDRSIRDVQQGKSEVYMLQLQEVQSEFYIHLNDLDTIITWLEQSFQIDSPIPQEVASRRG